MRRYTDGMTSAPHIHRFVKATLAIGLLALAGCQGPPEYRLVTHTPSGRSYYTMSNEIESLGATGQIRFYDHFRRSEVTLRRSNAEVEEISKVRYEQAVTRISD
jgi:hypothetical protein